MEMCHQTHYQEYSISKTASKHADCNERYLVSVSVVCFFRSPTQGCCGSVWWSCRHADCFDRYLVSVLTVFSGSQLGDAVEVYGGAADTLSVLTDI